jgi:hypothetical protein
MRKISPSALSTSITTYTQVTAVKVANNGGSSSSSPERLIACSSYER